MNRISWPRFPCAGCERFAQAALSARPFEGGRQGPGLLAPVLVSKYADRLPLYRQSQIYAREGIDLDRSTLVDWVGKSTALLVPIAEAIGRHVLAGSAIHAGDTTVRLRAPGTGMTQTARLWTYVRDERHRFAPAPPAALYRFFSDRRGNHPARHLAGFEELYRGRDVREVAYLAHVRHKFVHVHFAQGSAIAEEVIRRIGELYAVETRNQGSPPDERTCVREEHAIPVSDGLEAWLAEQLSALSGKTSLAGDKI